MVAAERLTALVEGKDPMLVMRMRSGFAVMSNHQFLKGYCLLLAYPEVSSLNDLSHESRAAFLHDMALLGDAVQRTTECKRINYSIYGNKDPFLHAHVIPRYDSEPDEYREVPPFSYPQDVREHWTTHYKLEEHAELQDNIRLRLMELLGHTPD
ncbi:MAG TPA: HIT domain-containing protein [Fimbriimonadaceae bacterium]|nr:HIT domain-containing protein [Fimbriimonadaceae bacterium]